MSTKAKKANNTTINGWLRSALWGLLVAISLTMLGWLRWDVCQLRTEVTQLTSSVAGIQSDISWLKGSGGK